MFKKILRKSILLLLAVFTFTTMKTFKAADSETTHVYFHYYRFDDDYNKWSLWAWQSIPNSLGGSDYSFETDETDISYNFNGVVAKVELSGDIENATELGFIVRTADWNKDIDADRFVEVQPTSPNGIQHVYLVEGDPLIGSSLDDPNGPSKNPKFIQSYFQSTDEIYFVATEPIDNETIIVLKDNMPLTNITVNTTNKSGVVKLSSNVDFSANYVISALFSNNERYTFEVTYDGIYDSIEFESAFHYTGDDLGAVVKNGTTTFRLWAPVSQAVVLNLYHDGTTIQDGGTNNTPYLEIPMNPAENGTFYYEHSTNLHNKYYTYTVTNGEVSNEVVDPYAVSTGVNGRRGLVVDFEQVNPDDFTYNTRANNMESHTDAIIYELHVRDLSTHSSWNGTEENRGKFLGLIEKGTTYEGYSTGFDHILDLGVTHIQLIPIYDFGVVDETKLDDPDYNAFNWGYMPLHFNAPEGSYSSDPYDGLTRVRELKQVTTAYTDNNLRLNMDVVYNHTGLSADSNFNLIIPGYYHRKTSTGAYSNGSGTGNETASERAMVRKFIVDSVVFWAEEYNISGFRFDLMALHDIQTMNEVQTALSEIDPTIMVYGEPWMGGTSTLPEVQQAGKNNLYQIDKVGAFNDDFRDAVKGSVFQREGPGYIQGLFTDSIINRVKYGIVGGVDHSGIQTGGLSTSKAWHTEPGKTINYVTAHDNNTLHDKLYQTNIETGDLKYINAMVKQAYAILMTSQGVAFMHAGDEILRSKPALSGDGFDHNSYQSPDSVNQIRWDQKAIPENFALYNYIKGLIALRNQTDLFRLNSSAAIKESLVFGYKPLKGVIAYQISDDQKILVIHNANKKSVKLELPKDSGWDIYVNDKLADIESLGTYKGGKGIKVPSNGSLILIENKDVSSVSSFNSFMNSMQGYTSFDQANIQSSIGFTLIIVGASIIALAAVGSISFILIKRNKVE